MSTIKRRRMGIIKSGGGLSSPPVAEWLFNNNLLDTSGNGYNLTSSGTTTYVLSGLGGLINAVSFSGSNYLRASTPILSKPIGISFWIKTSATNNIQMFAVTRNSGAGFSIQYNQPRAVYMNYNSNYIDLSVASQLNDGAWKHIVLTTNGENGDTVYFYVNSALASTATLASALTTGTFNYTIGVSYDLASYKYRGLMAGYRLFNQLLTQADVSYLYNNGNGI